MTHVFGTERLFAREYELSDAEVAFEIYGDPVVMRFIGSTKVSTGVSQEREDVAALRKKYGALGEPFGAFAIIERHLPASTAVA